MLQLGFVIQSAGRLRNRHAEMSTRQARWQSENAKLSGEHRKMMAGLLNTKSDPSKIQSKIHVLKSSCPKPGCKMSNAHEHIDNV
jgi:hypothetical protein